MYKQKQKQKTEKKEDEEKEKESKEFNHKNRNILPNWLWHPKLKTNVDPITEYFEYSAN